LSKFLEMVAAQGGDPKAVENAARLHPAPMIAMVPAPHDGVIAGCDCYAVGELVVGLGGGRRAKEDAIDPRVGLMVLRQPGERVKAGEPLAELHLAGPDADAVERAAACFTIADAGSTRPDVVLERIG
jgi:thymidine phosphorylase